MVNKKGLTDPTQHRSLNMGGKTVCAKAGAHVPHGELDQGCTSRVARLYSPRATMPLWDQAEPAGRVPLTHWPCASVFPAVVQGKKPSHQPARGHHVIKVLVGTRDLP